MLCVFSLSERGEGKKMKELLVGTGEPDDFIITGSRIVPDSPTV